MRKMFIKYFSPAMLSYYIYLSKARLFLTYSTCHSRYIYTTAAIECVESYLYILVMCNNIDSVIIVSQRSIIVI